MSGSIPLVGSDEVSHSEARPAAASRRRSLVGACLAHALHDGYTDLLYVLLPIWQTEFGLSYAGVAAMRSLYYGTMGGLQVPADRLMSRWPIRAALVLSTLVAAAGFLVMALTGSFWGLCAGLTLSGIGSSIQHPRGSLFVTHAYGNAARGPLGIYNFAGDLGKAVFPVLVALLLGWLAWRSVGGLMALVGIAVAVALLMILPRQTIRSADGVRARSDGSGDVRGFRLLLAIGALDTATRMGYLLFLPFLLRAKGGDESAVGLSLALVFAGGAFGKAACGWLGERFGVVRSVVATELATALLISATIPCSLGATLMVLPLIGIFLNGTSSVLYGTVPELAPGDVGRAFALFYTAVIGAGGLAPIAYGALADRTGETVGTLAAALTALAIVPLVLGLRRPLSEGRSPDRA